MPPFLFEDHYSPRISGPFCTPTSETYDQSGLQEVQLEDGSTAYIHHTVHMPQPNTILAIQADGTIADLQAEASAMDPETISVLEQYTTKVGCWDLDITTASLVGMIYKKKKAFCFKLTMCKICLVCLCFKLITC